MDEDQSHMTQSILDLTLEIVHLLTGEEYEVVKKTIGEQMKANIYQNRPSPITIPQPPSRISATPNMEKVLEVTKKMMELLTGEVPIRCQDVTIYFSMEEWEYLEGHKDLYKDVMTVDGRIRSLKREIQSNEKILTLSFEIIHLLIGMDCALVMKTSTEHNATTRSPHLSIQLSIPSLHKMHEKTDVQKVLKVTKRITELLTGEVPIRFQDVTVYFSMEEWEYLEGHKDLYKDVMMEDEPDGSRKRNPPQRCPLPLEDLSIPHHDQVGDGQSLVGSGHVEEKIKEEDEGVMEDLHEDLNEENIQESSDYKKPPQRCPRPLEDLLIPRQDQSRIHEDKTIPVKEEDEDHGVTVEIVGRKDLQDGSRQRNPPQRCPCPWDSTQGDYNTVVKDELEGGVEPMDEMEPKNRNPVQRCPRPLEKLFHDQGERGMKIKVEVKEEEEETRVMDYPQTMEKVGMMVTTKQEESVDRNGSKKRNPPQRCPRPLEDLPIPRHHQVGDEQSLVGSGHVEEKIKEEKDRVMEDLHEHLYKENMEESSTYKNPLQRCPRPLDSGDSTQEDHQGEELIYVKVEVKDEEEEEMYVRDDPPSTVTNEEESSLGIGADGRHVWNTSDGHLILSTDSNSSNRGRKKGNISRSKLVNGEKPFCCPQCGKCFIWRGDLLRHQRSHTGERPFSCAECGKCFTQKANLIVHERFHTGVRPYSCSECGKCFTRKGDLLRHQRTHTGERPFSCLDCGKSFTQKASLILHERLHTGVRPYSCSECGKSFTQKGDLLTHQSSHMVERPFSCGDCQKTFKKKSELVLHQRVHTGETFACSVCGKSFTKKYKLVTHERVHTGEKPFPCPECGKCFSIKGNLSKHMKCHTSEKPFSCITCGKCFTFKNSFIRHQKVHSGENVGPPNAVEVVEEKPTLP